MKLLITGATGFLGGSLVSSLHGRQDTELSCPVRYLGALKVGREMLVDGLGPETDWYNIVADQDVVIHAAARAHVNKDECSDPLAEFRKVNTDGTLNLARQSAEAGVKRLIFISSIGVNGRTNNKPFTEEDLPRPVEPYAQSKWEAEQGLLQIQRDTGMEIVIIRPPLVYGPNAPGNFGNLVRCIGKGVPLPLGAVYNKRSLVSLNNLVDLIITCIDHPAAANQLFLAGDGQDVSTTELLRCVGEAMGKPVRLIPVPARLLLIGASLLGKKAVAQRLLGSLQVDIGKVRNVLGWKPPFSIEEGLRQCFESEDAF